VPVNKTNKMLQSPVQPGTPHGEFIRNTSLIIWDEAPMANHAILTCVDEVCHLLMDHDTPFGGKVIILLGDFCQTCPVI
ncbi:DNA helicase Pif1 like protein, partial [Pisolithus orientalis]|uniref:DNA helicase Pif1 like protein n=1 Tax=Pisolithus orientalis TaxID=936130 RepID=UPI002225404E